MSDVERLKILLSTDGFFKAFFRQLESIDFREGWKRRTRYIDTEIIKAVEATLRGNCAGSVDHLSAEKFSDFLKGIIREALDVLYCVVEDWASVKTRIMNNHVNVVYDEELQNIASDAVFRWYREKTRRC